LAKDFDISELTRFEKDLLRLAETTMPKESKKFLKANARNLVKLTKKKAISLGIKKKTGNYYKGFKAGKVYKFNGDLSCRSFNFSPHAHLIEYGHRQVTKDGKETGFTKGKHVFEKTAGEFASTYFENVGKFIDDVLEKGL